MNISSISIGICDCDKKVDKIKLIKLVNMILKNQTIIPKSIE